VKRRQPNFKVLLLAEQAREGWAIEEEERKPIMPPP